MTTNEFINAFSDAIAYAEGFYVTGSRAQRNNNPGNITADITGTGIGYDGPFVKYANPEDGWEALYAQIEKMIDGTSIFYDSTMSIKEISRVYTATDQDAWANNVASRLGVSVDTTIDDMLQMQPTFAGMGWVAGLIALILLFRMKG